MGDRWFYEEQIRKFKDLKDRCPRPDRVEPIIQIYQEELNKLGEENGRTSTRQTIL